MIASNDNRAGTDTRVRVLIADDDARVRRALRALVELDPSIAVVGEACSTRDVLAYNRALEPSVILLDLLLPSLEDGLRTLRQLTRDTGRTVVAISLNSCLRPAALAAGARSFIDKGAAPDAFLAALHAALV